MYECAHSFITYNNLNIPSYDVHSVQARDQMLVNLYKLQQSFVKINNTITEKTKQQNQRIEKIRQRIVNCVNKIQELEGINKAICFVSPGQYPTRYKFDPERNVSIFKDFMERTKVNKFDLEAHYQMKHQIEKAGSASKLELDNLYKFVLYLYGKLKCKKMSSLESSIASKKVLANNLGRIPTTIRYVDSLSVFDTYINPYKYYQISPRKVVKKTKSKQQVEPVQQQIMSITNYTKPSYYMQKPDYKPAAQQVDDIPLDQDLTLDGVVDIDLDDFLSGMNSTGVVEKKVLQDPYKKEGNTTQQQNNYSQQSNYNSSQITASSTISTQSSLLPPPPPPPPNMPNLTLPPAPNLGNFSLPPPPPPPPSLGGSLPPPPSLGSLLPPPPILGSSLPPPPSLGSSLPPPPSLNLSIPAPAMPAPSFGSSGGSDRANLLKQLNQPNPILRLKKTITKQSPNIINLNAPPAPSNGPPGQAKPLSHADALRLKIMNRFKALHPEKEQSDDD